MTNHSNNTQGDHSAIARIALRCMRVYKDLLHGGLYGDSMLAALSATEVAVLREMMLETYDDYDVMNVGNAILFLDDEAKRREAVGGTATVTVTTDDNHTISS
jgi:hypothetical protein